MKKLITLISVLSVIVLAGCQTIEFVQSDVAPGAESQNIWHHNILFSLWEISDPVDLRRCPTGWQSVTVEESVLTAVAGTASRYFLFGFDAWDPWSVTITCALPPEE